MYINPKQKRDFCTLHLYAHSLPSGLAQLRKKHCWNLNPKADPVQQQILPYLKATGLEFGWKFKRMPWSEMR